MIKNLLICCLVLIGLTACEKEVDMSKLPSSDLYGHQIRDIISSDNTGSNWFKDQDINKWSKWKPVNSTISYGLTEEILRQLNCGFKIDNYNNISIMANAAKVANYDWKYVKPTSVFRTGDFRNYNPNDYNPCNCGLLQGTIISGDTNLFNSVFVFGNQTMGINDFTSISGTLGGMSNFYYGVAVISDNGVPVRWCTSDKTIGNSGIQTSISLVGLSSGTYGMLPFLTGIMKANYNDSEVGSHEFIYLPQSPSIFKLLTMSEMFVLGISEPYYYSNTRVGHCGWTFVNNYSQSVTISGYVRFKYVGNQPTSALQIGEKQVPISKVTVDANTSYSYVTTATNIGSNIYRAMYAYVSLTVTYGSKTSTITKQENLIKMN